MALASSWPAAAALILAERIGRALRKPTVEAMLSYSTGRHGRGWVYGVNTALDETGATIGPLLMALVLLRHQGFRFGYGLLLVPALLALASLAAARIRLSGALAAGWGRGADGAGPRLRPQLLALHGRRRLLRGGVEESFEFILLPPGEPRRCSAGVIPVAGGGDGDRHRRQPGAGPLYDRFGIRVVAAACPRHRRLSAARLPRRLRRRRRRPAALGRRLRHPGHPAQGADRGVLPRTPQPRLRPVLPRLRRRLACRQRRHGAALRALETAVGLTFAVAVLLASLPLFLLAARAERGSFTPVV